MKVYDVFISYRRTDGKTAQNLYEQLVRYGFSVFWDKTSLENGKFGHDIKVAIDHCDHFILLVNDNTLERCFQDEDDWILQEAAEAIRKKKNIVPLFIGNRQEFPKDLPERIRELQEFNGIVSFNCNSLDSMKELTNKFLSDNEVFSQDSDYEISGNILVKCIHPTLNMTIPDGIRRIENNAFSNCTSILEVHLNDSLEEIGENSFQRCRDLEYIVFPESVRTIQTRAFYRCHKIKTIQLPRSLRSVGAQAFAFCNNIREVTINEQLQSLDVTAFEECTKLRSFVADSANTFFCSIDGVLYNKNKDVLIKCPAGLDGTFFVPEGVKVVGRYAFANSNIKKIIFRSPIDEIERYAFLNSHVKEIDYPFEARDVAVDKISFSGCESLTVNPFAVDESEQAKSSGAKRHQTIDEFIIIKTSFESEEEAYNMIKMLLERDLIVSGQIKEHRAIYKWDGEISDEREIELLCFTRGLLYNDVEEYILEHHSYDCPEILCIPIINTSVSFGKWIRESTKKRR